MKHLADSRRRIRAHTHPAHALNGFSLRNRFPNGEEPEEIGIVHASETAQAVPTPNSRIDVEQFQFSVSVIAFEFNFDEARISNCRYEWLRCRRDGRVIDCLHKGAGAPEVHGKLPDTPCGERRERLAVLAERSVRKLRLDRKSVV